MKKIMMFLMLSVFFLMVGTTNGFAQKKVADEPEIQVISPSTISAHLGETVSFTFYVIERIEIKEPYLISLWGQALGHAAELLIRINQNGQVIYRAPFTDRITVAYDKANKKGTVTINGVKSEDEKIYFIAVEYGLWYWSAGTYLSIFRPQSFVKN